MSIATLKARILASLQERELGKVLAEIQQLPASRTVSALTAFLYHQDIRVKWHAVSAIGALTAKLADEDREKGRTVMRRLMWILNDESGNVGWGCHEAMGEIMARHRGLAEEYAKFLVAYMRGDRPYLELPALQRGLMWGVARVAMVENDLLRQARAAVYLLPYLDSKDPEVKGLAALALGLLRAEEAQGRLLLLESERDEVTLYDDGDFLTKTVGSLAAGALTLLKNAIPS